MVYVKITQIVTEKEISHNISCDLNPKKYMEKFGSFLFKYIIPWRIGWEGREREVLLTLGLKVKKLKVGLGLGQQHQYGGHEDFSSSFSVTMSPFRKTYNPRKFAI